MAAEAAISTLVQMLGHLLVQKVTFLKGVEDRVQFLKNELEFMQRFLEDAARKQAKDEAIRKWMSDIRELAYDAEDAIEIFTLKVIHDTAAAGLCCACWLVHAPTLNRVGEEIESIWTRLKDIGQRRMTYGIQYLGDHQGISSTVLSSRRSEEVERQRRLAPWEKDKDVVGLEEDMRLLLKNSILKERELGLSVATIMGMGGIGKSTLAKKIYNHAAVAARFKCRAWVVVSNEFKPEETIKQVMLQVQNSEEGRKKLLKDTKELEESMKDKQFLLEKLKEMLHKELVGQRYFVVLDDVWEQTHWDSLRTAFPDEQDKDSRLLITSRHQVTADYTQNTHAMKFLDSTMSWQLLLKKASIDGTCPENLEDIGEKILEKCYGLPLAINVVGGQLAKCTQSRIEWQKVLNGINFHLGRSINNVSAILELSYNKLPPQLKPCFLSLAFFKEDASIRAQKLVHIWIAQGLVLQEEKETLEDTARGYVDELINRNMVQVKDTSIDGRVKTCVAHDFIRELSVTKAKEEINFEILTEEEGNSNQLFLDKPRHRAMYCSSGRSSHFVNHNKHVRSLFVYGVCARVDDVNPSYWKSFEVLKVLDFEGCKLKKLPSVIGELIGLRYLGLRNTKISKLPGSLGKLKNLQVIDLRGSCIKKVPYFVIQKMYNLRHLYISEIWCKLHPKIGHLKNIQTLSCVLLRDSDLEQITKMTHLRKLGIDLKEVTDVSMLFTSLAALKNLERLNLRRCGSLEMDGLSTLQHLTHLKLQDELTMSPRNFPPNLNCLSLVDTNLNEDPMPVLEKLPNLQYLKLVRAYSGRKMVISSGEFPELKQLYLKHFLKLSNIKVGKDGMPVLKKLEIYECPDLKFQDVLKYLRRASTTTNNNSKLGNYFVLFH